MSAVLLALSITAAAPGPKDGKKDPPALVGEWAAEALTEDGKPVNVPPGTTWAFTADGKSVLTIGDVVGTTESAYTVDAKKDPPHVDKATGPKGSALRGIYKVEKDTLTLCLVEADRDRPTAFEAPAGSKVVLVTLKRLKK
jgi:uncharacterized protein (TIGR03067 family)